MMVITIVFTCSNVINDTNVIFVIFSAAQMPDGASEITGYGTYVPHGNYTHTHAHTYTQYTTHCSVPHRLITHITSQPIPHI